MIEQFCKKINLAFLYQVHYIVLMNAINYTELRQNLKTHMDNAYQDHDPLIITRKDNQNMILMSLDDYNSITETQYLLSTESNTNHLLKSLKDSRENKVFQKDLIEE